MSHTIVCVSSYYKGYDFMEECHNLGNKVILITSESLREKNWPWHAIDETYYMPEVTPYEWNLDHFIKGFSYLMSMNKIAAVVALDDFDVEKAALIRETFRIAGMGQTTHRYFRDKLAMRQMAKDQNIPIPSFTAVFNNEEVADFVSQNPAPWVLKPRSEASATGIKKLNSEEELWEVLQQLQDERHKYLLESFKPGDVFHVDSLVYDHKVIFSSCSQYLNPPLEVSHEGGVFRTKTLSKKSNDFKELAKLNSELLTKFGMKHGASHSEFIKSKSDGQLYFLETSSRVGGANIHDLIEAATGINIWREWARLETAILNQETYKLPKATENFAGLFMALAKHKHPDMSAFECKELYKIIPVDYHVGAVFKAKTQKAIEQILENSAKIIMSEHLQVLPPLAKSNN